MLTYTDIQRLASEGEGKSIEFKETTGQLDRGMETLCAFLNGNGGTLLFGITDNGKIIGQDISDKTRRDIADALLNSSLFQSCQHRLSGHNKPIDTQ